MKSIAVMLLIGAISTSQAVQLGINNNQVQAIDMNKAADKKAAADANQKAMMAAQKAKESWKKVQAVSAGN